MTKTIHFEEVVRDDKAVQLVMCWCGIGADHDEQGVRLQDSSN